MGLFGNKQPCSVCGGKVPAIVIFKTIDGPLCTSCHKKCSPLASRTLNNRPAEEARQHIASREANLEKYKAFSPTDTVSNYLHIDRRTQSWCCPSLDANNPDIFSFSELVDFEMVEDGVSVTKGGLGSAIVGGALFGVAGAIVGGGLGKKQKDIVNKMSIIIKTRNDLIPRIEISLINTETKRGGFTHKNCKEIGNKIISLLSVIADSQTAPVAGSVPVASAADELMKYKQLLDAGAITQEEFDAKKKQLLGL